MTWLDYFLLYCSTGAIVLLSIPLLNYFLKRDVKSSRAPRSFLKLDPVNFQEGILELFLVPLVGFTLVLLCWPVVIYFFIKENWFPDPPYVEKVFAVEKAHLGKPLSLEHIEALERVHDPMGAVPDLPFGHLNVAWRDFLEEYSAGDTLWSFSSIWQGDWGCPEQRAGYVIVRADSNIGPHFLTRWINLDAPAPSGSTKRSKRRSTNRYDIPDFLRKESD